MAINHSDGRFCLFLWLDRDGNGESSEKEYSDVRDELDARAKKVIAAGTFQVCVAGRLERRYKRLGRIG